MKLHLPLKALLMSAVAVIFSLPSLANVMINEGNGVNIVMENEQLKLNIAVEGGARISSFVNKRTGKDWVTLWKGPGEDGGLLDSRHEFTPQAFRAVVVQRGGGVGQVRLSAELPDGKSIVKVLTLREGESALEVSETFANGSQQPARFLLRSFLLPNGTPQNEDNQYFLPLKDKPLQPQSLPNGWIENVAAPWSALWNSKNGEGILVAAPGIDKFYFWQSSKIFPTYEWGYPDIPAGKSITVNYSLRLFQNPSPDWPLLSAQALKKLRPLRTADVPGWQNEEQRFQVTASEKNQGFWLSVANGKDKRRLPERLGMDVPLQQVRSFYIGFNALKDFEKADLQVHFKGIPNGLLQAAWQVSGKDTIQVQPFEGSTSIDLKQSAEGRLWLTLQSAATPVDAKGEIEVTLNGQRISMPLDVKVWPVQVPQIRPFEVQGYGNFPTMAGGYAVTPETIRQTNAMLDHFQAIGGNVLDWTVAWSNMFPHLKIEGSEQTVTAWLKQNLSEFEKKPAAEWPSIDFRYYDPWMEAAKAHGLTRASTYLGYRGPRSLPVAQEEWLLVQLKKYLQGHGIQKFICKISDEIPTEEIPAYIEQAQLARRAGWRPSTTVTGGMARSATEINQINPYMDKWVLGHGSTLYFDNLIHASYQVQEKTLTLPAGQWRAYGNGGAQNTVAQRVFKTLVPEAANELESVELWQNGQPLMRAGGSPHGNRRQGVFFAGLNDHIYLSPLPETDVKQATVTIKYRVRVPAATGEPLAKVDADDEIWFYGGRGQSYRHLYEEAATYPLKALQGKYDGFAYYAFYRWDVDRVLWYDEASEKVSVGPAFLGLRDGWNDACLLAWLEQNKKVPVSRFMSEEPDAPLRIGEVQQEIYRWKDVVNLTDPFQLNDARRAMLAAAVK